MFDYSSDARSCYWRMLCYIETRLDIYGQNMIFISIFAWYKCMSDLDMFRRTFRWLLSLRQWPSKNLVQFATSFNYAFNFSTSKSQLLTQFSTSNTAAVQMSEDTTWSPKLVVCVIDVFWVPASQCHCWTPTRVGSRETEIVEFMGTIIMKKLVKDRSSCSVCKQKCIGSSHL